MCIGDDTFLLGIFDYIIFPTGELRVSGCQESSCTLSSLLHSFFVLFLKNNVSLLVIEPRKVV